MPNLDKGYEILNDFLTPGQLNAIHSDIQSLSLPANTGGIRNIEKKSTAIQALATSEQLETQAQQYLIGSPCFVRGILFNKTVENNWLVAWHQDRTVAVSKKFDASGWGPWSMKDGVIHVQPPLSVLNQMITFRLHLDEANQENGCLQILPSSQKLGVLDQHAIQHYVDNHEAIACEALAGSALVMRPHVLHASAKALVPSQRRVLHLEYSSFQLPVDVAWASAQ